MGHQAFYCAGELDRDSPDGVEVPEMHFAHPRARLIHDEMFIGPAPGDLFHRIVEMADELEVALATFVDRFSIDCLFVENALAIPMHLPLGLALTNFIAQSGLPAIAHHHDLAWERQRFSAPALPEVLERCFPPDLPSAKHVVINSLAQKSLYRRRGLSSRILPNLFDFETPPPGVDAFAAGLRAELGLRPGDWLILQPTRVVARKGIELAIELLRRLSDPRCVLVITHHAGDEGLTYLERIEALAARAGIDLRYVAERFAPARHVAAGGTKTYSLWDAYAAADFVTYPSLVEGFGNALLETIYFGLPALVNRYPVYVADIAPLGFKFVEIDRAITDTAVERARVLLEDKALRCEMTARNFSLARRYFSYAAGESMLEQILSWD
jgi:glycosyltransferase involved in cell wall biosynthesis